MTFEPISNLEIFNCAIESWNAGDLDGYLNMYDEGVLLYGYPTRGKGGGGGKTESLISEATFAEKLVFFQNGDRRLLPVFRHYRDLHLAGLYKINRTGGVALRKDFNVLRNVKGFST